MRVAEARSRGVESRLWRRAAIVPVGSCATQTSGTDAVPPAACGPRRARGVAGVSPLLTRVVGGLHCFVTERTLPASMAQRRGQVRRRRRHRAKQDAALGRLGGGRALGTLARPGLNELGDDGDVLGFGEALNRRALRLNPETRALLLPSRDTIVGNSAVHTKGIPPFALCMKPVSEQLNLGSPSPIAVWPHRSFGRGPGTGTQFVRCALHIGLSRAPYLPSMADFLGMVACHQQEHQDKDKCRSH